MKKVKPLKQEDFNIRIIADLGMRKFSKKKKPLRHYAIFECSDCKSHFTAQTAHVKFHQQKFCHSCSARDRHRREKEKELLR